MERSIIVSRSALGFAVLAAFLLPQVGAHAQGSAEAPDGLGDADWRSIREAHEASRYAAFEADDGYRARNPGQQWVTQFDGRGFSVLPDAGGWTWGLELVSYGFAGAERAVAGAASVSVSVSGQRVAYGWDATLEEWYVNDTRGLEHGYTLLERPTRSEGREPSVLCFTLAIRGELCAEVQDDGRGVRFVNGEGAVVLTYTGLLVLDAEGQNLPARLEPVCDGLRLCIDERGARYPLTIDPIVQQAYFKASNTGAGDRFGASVAISGDTVVVGAELEDSNATGVGGDAGDDSAPDSGAAYVFVRSGTSWSQQAYLKASNTEADDRFGLSVSISGDTVVVGAYREDSSATGIDGDQGDNAASGSGAAYVFVRSGTSWSQQAYLKASNTESADDFGVSVEASEDTVVVGAYGEDSNATGIDGDQGDNSAQDSGAAYVFVRSGTTWTQQAYLKASNTEAVDRFGRLVSISGDTAVVTALLEDSSATGVDGNQGDNGALDSGAAYVFVRSGATWTQQAYVKASNTEAGDGFGTSLSISDDTVVVGAWMEDSSATGVNGNPSDNGAADSGAAYVFVRGGTTWTQQAYLKASNTEFLDGFGIAASISGDTVVVAAHAEDSSATGVDGNQGDNSAPGSGAVYVFVRNGASWTQQAYLKASNTGTGDQFGGEQFGEGVAVSGETVVVGATAEDSNATGVDGDQSDNSASESGAVYVLVLSLTVDVEEISLATGGTQTLDLDASPANAFGLYYLLTTTTGTSPGLPLTPTSLILPLNFSNLLLFTALNPNVLIPGSLAFLDASGQGTTTVTLGPGLDPGLSGVGLHHAYVLLETVSFTATFASNPVPLFLKP